MTHMPKTEGRCGLCHLLPAAFYSDGAPSISALETLWSGRRLVKAGQLIYQEEQPTSEFGVLFDGWALSSKLLPDGRRQILSFILPGDPLALPLLHADRLPFSVQALTEVTICTFPRAEFASYIAARSRLSWQADHVCIQATTAAYRLVVDIGRRFAYERVGSLILDLAMRLKARGLSDGRTAHLPLRQLHLADALGLTPIHVGRVLQRLHVDGILTLSRGRLEIHDLNALQRL